MPGRVRPAMASPVRRALFFATVLALGSVLIGCGARAPVGAGPTVTATPTAAATATATPRPQTSAEVEASVRARATAAVHALKAKDFATVASLAHPAKGVRFSPYAFVDTARHVVLDPATIRLGFANTKTYLWGHTSGKGDPMEWTFEQFYTRQLYNKDYAASKDVGYERHPQRGNSIDNSATAYPQGRSVDYYIPSTDPNTTLDWGALRLVFEEQGGTWYLVGVIHDEWTI